MKEEILFITSYPPRECGIATFTKDLINTLEDQFSSSFNFSVCALEDGNAYQYPDNVKYSANMNGSAKNLALARRINKDSAVKVVCIQHEFGLFGGDYGKDLLSFIHELNKPIAVVFHTALPSPNKGLKSVVKSISLYADKVITMTDNSSKILIRDYAVDKEKLAVIPHGTHLMPGTRKQTLKEKYGLQNHLVLSTFGLISSNKSIETSIEAMPKIVEFFPKAMLLILGKTHPGVLKNEGEKYRSYLQSRVKALSLQKNVKFIDKYLALPELLEYLKLTDIYLFTSKDPNQAVSGTFAYAMSCGCPIISTPIPHAVELLDDDTGVFFDFENANQLAEAAISLLSTPQRMEEMSLNAIHKIQPTIWQNSAVSYVELFRDLSKSQMELRYDLPEINVDHVHNMTTDTGMIQFSKIDHPDLASGYTLDDNARALIAMTLHYVHSKDTGSLKLIDTYLNFIGKCQTQNGRFLNYVDQHGEFHSQNDQVNLDDSNGRAIWALGTVLSHHRHLPQHIVLKAKYCLYNASEWVIDVESPRAIGFIVKGLYYAYQYRETPKLRHTIRILSEYLLEKYFSSASKNWQWFEGYLTYANSILPEAMLYSYAVAGNREHLKVALDSLNFLLSQTFTEYGMKVISNNGWHHKEQKQTNKYGEQPIDVSYTIQTLDAFYNILKANHYKDYMHTAFNWFLGRNYLNQIVHNPVSGGCYDGLEKNNPNLNQGAESTVCYLTARLILEKHEIGIAREREIAQKKIRALSNQSDLFVSK